MENESLLILPVREKLCEQDIMNRTILTCSLDELVTGKETEQQEKQEEPEVVIPPQTEPKIVYVEKPIMPTISAAQILGMMGFST